ncbi:MAG: GNAT family N-acetyltransferase, partial [Bacteroidales bacterium]
IIKGYTSYLKFLFVHPKHRDKKIGSALLSNYFMRSKDAKLMILWVLLSNENAVGIYKHYGFQMDNFYNIVLTKKLIKNGKENK